MSGCWFQRDSRTEAVRRGPRRVANDHGANLAGRAARIRPDCARALSVSGRSLLSGISYPWRQLDLARFVESETDAVVAQVVSQFVTADRDAQQSIRDGLDDDDLYTVRAFSQRRAVSALRTASVDFATQGLLGIALIDKARIDFRDLSVDLPHYALHEVGGDAEAVLRRGAAISEPGTAELFALAIGRARQPRSLAQCLELPVVSTYGFGLMDTWGHRFETAAGLPVRAIEIADTIDSVTPYETTMLTAGTELPPIWLEGPDTGKRAQMAAAAVRACISIHAELDGVRFSGPRLIIFLTEAIDKSHADELSELARRYSRPGQHQTAVTRDNLALIVNAGASTFGGSTTETAASLDALVASFATSLIGDRG
jgi:hypothetical protein